MVAALFATIGTSLATRRDTLGNPGVRVPVLSTVTGPMGQVVAVQVTGIDPRRLDAWRGFRPSYNAWAEAFDVRVADADASFPSLAGRYQVLSETLRFTPPYPFVPGQSYHVRLAAFALDTAFTVASRSKHRDLTAITAVYPTADVLPMNQLKLYVHFSAPMRTGEVSTHVRIIDEATGRVVPDAFFSPDDELWNPAQTRLTLLFDPGRIKRGLKPNEQLGLPLHEGRRYRLVFDATWSDANGDPLRRGFEKRFAVSTADRTAPRAAAWHVSTPRAGTLDTLTVTFGEPMDEALLERLLVVRDVAGTALAGRRTVGRREDQWHFAPTTRWRAGRYVVDVSTDLEDLAGNNLRRLFDTDLRDRAAPALEAGDLVRLVVTVPST